MMVLLFRALTNVTIGGPHYFTSEHITALPSFLQNPQEWELVYVPSNIKVVKEIAENMKRNLNINIKG